MSPPSAQSLAEMRTESGFSAGHAARTAVSTLGKARFGREHTSEWVLGEDSGIEVAALGGRPGLDSARWARRRRRRALLERARRRRATGARGTSASSSRSRPEGEELRGTGMLEGTIAPEPRGDEGFGYDPIFVPDGEERTVAELGNDWKREHSHRALARAKALDGRSSGRRAPTRRDSASSSVPVVDRRPVRATS